MYLQNKYSKCYFNIIERAKSRTLTKDTYYEKHHILPKSLTGDNSAANLVRLTAREHFICHWLLTKMTTGEVKSKMVYALNGMCRINKNQKRYSSAITAKVYERAKKLSSLMKSKSMKGKPRPEIKGKPSKRKGRKFPGAAHLGRCRPEIKGIKRGPQKNPQGPKTKVTCPHCGKIGGVNNMKRYHFDMCLLSGNAVTRPAGKKGVNGKEIVVNGITYESIEQAANGHNMTRYKFLRWFSSIQC